MKPSLTRRRGPRTAVAPQTRRPVLLHPRARAASPFALALALATASTDLCAHGLDAGHVQIVLHDRVVEAVATPSVSLVPSADTDHDGRLTLAEVDARRDEIRRSLLDGFVVTDADGARGEVERADVSLPRDGDLDAGRDYLRLTVVLRWARPPASLRVRCALIGDHPVTVMATRAEPSSPGVLGLVGEPAYALLSRPDETASLLAPIAAAPSAPAPVTRAAEPSTPRRGWLVAACVAALALSAAWLRRRSAPPTSSAPQGAT